MSEEVGQPNPEASREPVEIKFGDVVRFRGKAASPNHLYVIVDPASETVLFASRILNDKDGEEELGGAGTIPDMVVEVAGNWPLRKVIEGSIRHFLASDGSEVPGIREIYEKDLEADSQKPPVMYRGSE